MNVEAKAETLTSETLRRAASALQSRIDVTRHSLGMNWAVMRGSDSPRVIAEFRAELAADEEALAEIESELRNR
jgi:hypothetical protein